MKSIVVLNELAIGGTISILGKAHSLLEIRGVFWDKGSGKHVKALFAWKTDGYSGLFPG